MSDLIEELDAAVCLVHEALDRLRKLDPRHELLQYVPRRTNPEKQAACDCAMLARFCRVPPEFKKSDDGQLELFPKIVNGTLRWADGLCNYWRALTAAIDGLECRSPQPVLS